MQNIRGVYVLQENCKMYIKVNQTVFSRIRVESTTAQEECTYLQAHPVESLSSLSRFVSVLHGIE